MPASQPLPLDAMWIDSRRELVFHSIVEVVVTDEEVEIRYVVPTFLKREPVRFFLRGVDS